MEQKSGDMSVHKVFAHPVTWSALVCFPLRHGAATLALLLSSCSLFPTANEEAFISFDIYTSNISSRLDNLLRPIVTTFPSAPPVALTTSLTNRLGLN